jgi:hypothetical protein
MYAYLRPTPRPLAERGNSGVQLGHAFVKQGSDHDELSPLGNVQLMPTPPEPG